MIARMQRRGLQVDLAHFAALEKTLAEDLERTTGEIQAMTGYWINPGSGDQVADLLFKRLGLQQAKVKMTASGDRESVEDEVLTAIQHQHPVVGKCLEYKEIEKLLGTYVRPMPKLAKRTALGKWRIYPNFRTTRVPSGRLACADPNLLAMPTRTERGRDIRKGFITDTGWKFLSVDECLHPSTLVKTLLGDKPISEIHPGDKVLTHRGDTIKWGSVTKSSHIQPRKAYKITFDNGLSVVASDTHRWPVQMTPSRGKSEIQQIETRHLRVWDRMVPCRVMITPTGYKQYYSHRGSFHCTPEHEIVAEAFHGPRPKDSHIHHKNEDKLCNQPDNLEYVNNRVHLSSHAKEHYPKQDHTKRIEALREALKLRRTYDGEGNPNSKLSQVDLEVIQELTSIDGWKATQVAEYFNLSYGYARRLVKRFTKNHKIISIECVGVQPMWAITVEPDHNYVLSCGVVTCNSQIEVRIAAHRSQDINLCNVYINEEDVYSDFAITAFRLADKRYKPEDGGKWKYPGVDPMEHRRPSKTCVLASIYDVTAGGLQEQLPIVCGNCNKPATCLKCAEGKPHNIPEECVQHGCANFRPLWTEDKSQHLITAFYSRYPGLMRMRIDDHNYIRQHAYIVDDWGRLQHITAIRSVLSWVGNVALREGANLPMQGTAQGTLKISMAEIDDILDDNKLYSSELVFPNLQVHDELIFECHESVLEDVAAITLHVIENCVRLNIPLKASACWADSWGLLEK